jgi:predicted transcriptional regulator
MEIKKIKIGIKSTEQLFKGFAETFKQAQRGEPVEKKEGIFFENVTALRAFLTPRRIELIRAIHQEKPESAYELAQLVQRDVKSVMTDLVVLESLGLVELQKEEGKVHPLVEYDAVQVEIKV